MGEHADSHARPDHVNRAGGIDGEAAAQTDAEHGLEDDFGVVDCDGKELEAAALAGGWLVGVSASGLGGEGTLTR